MRRRHAASLVVVTALVVLLVALHPCGTPREPEPATIAPPTSQRPPASPLPRVHAGRTEESTRTEEPATVTDSSVRPNAAPSAFAALHRHKRGKLEIVVVSEVDGTPVIGAEVTAAPFGGSGRFKSTSDSTGIARFEEVVEGGIEIDVVPVVSSERPFAPLRRVLCGLGRHEVRMVPTPVLVVRVVDETGNAPREPVVVGWRRIDDSFPPRQDMAPPLGADGRVAIALEDGSYRISVGAKSRESDLVYVYRQPIDARAGEVTITIVHGRPIEIECIDEKGAPPPSVTLFRVRPAGELQGIDSDAVQAGVLRSRPLALGRYDVDAWTTIDGRRIAWGEVRGVEPGSKSLRMVLGPGGRVSGRVEDADGRPPAKARRVRVAVDHDDPADPGAATSLAFAMTDENGSFEFAGLPSLPLRLEVFADQGPPWPPIHGVLPGATDVVLRYGSPCEIRGRVMCKGWVGPYEGDVGTRNGLPVPLKEDGTFVLAGLAPGKLRLLWYAAALVIDLGEVVAPSADLVIDARLP